MKKLQRTAVLAVLAAFLLVPAAATAETSFTINYKGLAAYAEFSSTDPADPCILREVLVVATNDAFPRRVVAQVAIGVSNTCSERLLQRLFGVTETADFRGDKPLSYASLMATIPVEDFRTHAVFDVDVDVTWAGVGPTSKQNASFHVKRPGYQASGHFNGTSRQATAAGGVSDGVTDFTGGEPATRAWLEWARVGLLEITSG